MCGNIGNWAWGPVFTIVNVTAPTVTITAPVSGAHVYYGKPTTISWTATDPVATAQLNYLVYLIGGTTGCTATNYTTNSCQQNVTVTSAGGWTAQGTITATWTPIPPAGTSTTNYQLIVTATDPSNLTGSATSSSFSIITCQTNPTVTVSAPTTGISIQSGNTYNITWNASDACDSTAKLNYTISLSTNGGSSFPTTIASLTGGNQASQTFSWAASGPTGSSYPLTSCVIQVQPPIPMTVIKGVARARFSP